MTDAQAVRDAATLVSVTFAVLSAFTTQRAASCGRQSDDLANATEAEIRRDCWIDGALLALAGLLLVTLAPLVAAAWRESGLGHTSTAFYSTFFVLCLAIIGVVIWLATVLVRRLGVLKAKTV